MSAILRDPLLALLADDLDRWEAQRIASENQYRQLTRVEIDSDGQTRGFGLSEALPAVRSLRASLDVVQAQEHQAVLRLQRQVRQHKLGSWINDTPGVGEKQGARLLASIGDPYWNDLHDRPRIVSELWAYCGHHVVNGAAARRRRGEQSNWSDTARMRVHLVAESCMKQPPQTLYRKIYDDGRARYTDATHRVDCVRCGPAGKPAVIGSALSLGHQHARALRLVAKEILRDLWLVSRELHAS